MTIFEIGISRDTGSGDRFRVQVLRSPVGETAAEHVDLDVPGLTAQHDHIQQALLASSNSGQRVIPIARLVQQIGQQLFTALLGTGAVASRYRSAIDVARDREDRFHIVVRLDAPELAALPWEAMHDPHADSYVCRTRAVLRRIPIASLPAPLQVRLPLRILGVVSSPHGLAHLDVDREKAHVEQALRSLIDQDLIHLHWVRAVWSGLHATLMDGPWHVIHYVGHGDYDPTLGQGVLAFERQTDGRADLVTADRLTDLLDQADPAPRMVVLNSCSGATTGASNLFSSTAATLVRGGTSAVTAMQYGISDSAAIAFAHGFYTALAHGRSVDQAVTAGRIEILGTSPTTLEWITPVLYLRGDQTRLFALSDPSTAHSGGMANTKAVGRLPAVPDNRPAQMYSPEPLFLELTELGAMPDHEAAAALAAMPDYRAAELLAAMPGSRAAELRSLLLLQPKRP